MHKSSFKALYIFLTGLLGMVLLLLLHRALFVIYDLMSVFFPDAGIFQLDRLLIQTVDFASLIFALFVGGWYGIYLGLHWYALVYSEGNHNKLFHGFLPHHWRKGERAAIKSNPGVPKKIVAHAAANDGGTKFQVYRRKPAVEEAWSLDDLTPKTPKRTVIRKSVTKKPATKKVVRKSVVKKKVAEQQAV